MPLDCTSHTVRGNESVGELLSNAKPGDERSMEALLPLVYNELRMIAASFLHRQPGHTLQPTALVHEAFVKMVGNDKQWFGRDHFMRVAAKAMRHVLVDHARAKGAEKRGGGAKRADISVEGFIEAAGTTRELRVMELDELLTALAKADERAAMVAEMRLFGGMEKEQIARAMGISTTTVSMDWKFARAWLASKFQGSPDER